MRDVHEFGRVGREIGQGVTEHGVAEGAGGADDVRAGVHEFFGAGVADAVALLFAEEGEAAAGSAAEAAFAGTSGVNLLAEVGDAYEMCES